MFVCPALWVASSLPPSFIQSLNEPRLPSRLNHRCLDDHVRHMLVLHDYLTTKKKVGLNKEEWVGGSFDGKESRQSGERHALAENSSVWCEDKGGEEKHLNLGCIYIPAEVSRAGSNHIKMDDGSGSLSQYAPVSLLHSSCVLSFIAYIPPLFQQC